MDQTSKVQCSGKLMNGSVKERVLPNLAYLIQAMKERKKSIFYTTALSLETFNDYVDTILPFFRTPTYLLVDIFNPERGQK